jgi:hypothetical protein
MTHNRKPDVQPVEGASIAEALLALDRLAKRGAHLDDEFRGVVFAGYVAAIRSALERAAAEGEARGWEPWPAFPRSPRCESTNPNHYDFRCCLDLGHEGQHQASAGNRMDAIKWASKGEE